MNRKLLLFGTFFIVVLMFFALYVVFMPSTKPKGQGSFETTTNNGFIQLPSNQNYDKTYEGKVSAVISNAQTEGAYELLDANGNTIILLKSNDDKLKLAEGRQVQVTGPVERTADGKSYIMNVEKVTFKQ